MESKRFIILGTVFAAMLAVLFMFIPGPAARADDCAITKADLGKIDALQNDQTLSALDRIKQELSLRKQLIAITISCGKADVQSLQAKLQGLNAVSGTDALKEQLSGKLDDATNFYDIERGKLDDAGIAGSQAIAKELLAWRAGSYAPIVGEINNFFLWTANQDVFSTARNRMQETERAAGFLEAVSKNTDLEKALGDAQASFAAANAKNDDAKSALIQFVSPDQSLSLIKESLDALSDTYKKFSIVSDVIKNILPQ